VIDLTTQCALVYRQPVGEDYELVETFADGLVSAATIDGVSVDVAELFRL
jgi:hypothetical protein